MRQTLIALTTALVCAAQASAQQLITEYSAYIGFDDLTNSSGARLTQPWQVVRQDRANVHRFRIRQQGDDVDPIFGSIDARGQLERLIQAGFISETAASAILRGNVRLRVSVFGDGGFPQRVEVQVWDEPSVTATAPSTVTPAPAPEQPPSQNAVLPGDQEPEL